MKIIKKYRNPDGGIFPDWWYEAKANLTTDNSDNDLSFNFLKVPYYLRFGLNEVDKAGTPVITTTPWVREFNDQEWSNYWDLFVPEAL